jgi:hypothetical protein
MSSAPMRDVLWMHGARSRLRELLDTAHKEGGRSSWSMNPRNARKRA